MEVTEEVILGPKEQSTIVKGKRTKRLRPQSPIPFAISNNNNSLYNDDNVTKNVAAVSPPSSSSSSSFRNGGAATTEEEEDMANCLILLAQGQSRVEPLPIPPSPKRIEPFTSRRFLEASSTGGGKAGYYVYECKTCNRTFPSFQALGGHRASHKKPKFPAEEKRYHLSSDEEETHLGKSINNAISSLSLQLNSNGGNYNDLSNNRGGLYNSNTVMINNKGKVHECSICGAEFTSGQALGGHMRRHRGPVAPSANAAAASITTLSLSAPMVTDSSEESKKTRNVLNLELDLNLPAPEDDHREGNMFAFASKQEKQEQQQQPQPKSHMVFSAPALVDCHY